MSFPPLFVIPAKAGIHLIATVLDSCFRRNDSTLLLETVFAKQLYESDVTDYSLNELVRLLPAAHQRLRSSVTYRGNYKAAIDKLPGQGRRYLRHRGGNHNPVEISLRR